MGLGHLVEHLDPVALFRRVLQRQFNAANRILDMDESPCLATGAVNRQRIADGCLDQEPVQNRAIVAVIVEPVDQLFVAKGLFRMRAPDDSLVQVSDL